MLGGGARGLSATVAADRLRAGGRAVAVALAAVALAAVALALAGCAASQAPVQNLSKPLIPRRFGALDYPKAGVAVLYPQGWAVSTRRAPLIAVVSSGTAVIDLWRYTRRGPVLRGAKLAAARRALVAAVRAHDPGLRVLGADTTTVGGAGAVELDAVERIGGAIRRVRSEHLYPAGAEVVLEEYAPPAAFARIDRGVFDRVRRHLVLTSGGKVA